MSIDFHRLIEAIDNNRLIIIDYIDYIDCLPMIVFHRLGTPRKNHSEISSFHTFLLYLDNELLLRSLRSLRSKYRKNVPVSNDVMR